MSKKRAYVVGANVSTSLSPAIFNHWFEKYNIDAEYGYKEIQEESFDEKIKQTLKEDGLVGLNITIPYKEKILSYIDNKDSTFVPRSVNCVTIKKTQNSTVEEFQVFGESTDSFGFDRALYTNTAPNAFEKQSCAIVLGYGGAAKAIIHSLVLNENFNRIIIFNRTFDRLKGLGREFGAEKTKKILESRKIEELHMYTKNAHLIVNTTPTNTLSALPRWDIGPKCYGFDIVYRPRKGTGFLKHFEPNNRIEGIQMLIYQAAPCFKRWFGVNPEIEEGLLDRLYEEINKI